MLKSCLTCRFLQTAEMLKPSTPSTSHDSSPEENADYFPNVGRLISESEYNNGVYDHKTRGLLEK